MNQSVADALDYCGRAGVERFILIAPNATPSVRCNFGDRIIPTSTERLFPLLVTSRRPVVFAGASLQITRCLMAALLLSGRTQLICRRDDNCIGPLSFASLLVTSYRRRLVGRLRNLPARHPAARMLHALRGDAKFDSAPEQQDSEPLDPLVEAALKFATAVHAIPGRVILINDGLASGGAERQIVNTLLGLQNYKGFEASFLGERLGCVPGIDFYKADLEHAKIPIVNARWRSVNARAGLPSVDPEIADALCRLPLQAVESILNLIDEFRCRRPSVVHAWQDSTSVHVGIAALICGIPRIILSARNISPVGTQRFRPYLKPAYIALATCPNVTLTNNSEAGAQSYADWLKLPRDRFVVLRNGVDITKLEATFPCTHGELDLPDESTIISGVFRLTPTKRPLLWIETAIKIAESNPEIHFIIGGDGPLRVSCEARIETSGLSEKFHLLGEISNPARLLQISSALLLTSEMEGAANILLEAQSFGVPVICTDVGGNSDSLQDGVTGWLSPSENANDLAELVVSVISDQDKIASAKTKGRAFIERRFGLERMVVETLGLYTL